MNADESAICVICQEELGPIASRSSTCRTLNCAHIYHRTCFAGWIRNNPAQGHICPFRCNIPGVAICYHGNDIGTACVGCGGFAQSMRCRHGVPLIDIETRAANHCLFCRDRLPRAVPPNVRRPATPPGARCLVHDMQAHPQCGFCILARLQTSPRLSRLSLDQLYGAIASAHAAVTSWVSVPEDNVPNVLRHGLYGQYMRSAQRPAARNGFVIFQILNSYQLRPGRLRPDAMRRESTEGTEAYRSRRAQAIRGVMENRGSQLQRDIIAAGLSDLEILVLVHEARDNTDDSDLE
jgi:hypothetical protein